jgi:hypothetical protein
MGYGEPRRGEDIPQRPIQAKQERLKSGFDQESESFADDDLELDTVPLYGVERNNKKLIEGVDTISWPGALPRVPYSLGGTTGGNIAKEMPASRLLLYIYGYEKRIDRAIKDSKQGSANMLLAEFQSNFRFETADGLVYTNFQDFAQLRRFYRTGRKYKNKQVATQTSGIHLMKDTFDFYMGVEEALARKVGTFLPTIRPDRDPELVAV